MKKFLKKKFSSPILLLVLVLAVLVTGIVVYTVTATSLKQTTTNSQASVAGSCAGYCKTHRATNQAACAATCEDVTTGEATCTEFCSYFRTSQRSACMTDCEKRTPVAMWCNNAPCNLGQTPGTGGQSGTGVGGTGFCVSMCTQVNSGQTCTQVCDGQFPAQGGSQTANNKRCKTICPSWVMPVPSPLPVTQP